ncbi:MAG: tetratricopeptide repeat protein [Leptolyngbyaceae cyanobacterium bins.302]|nr:tetratricopeptide repeat protein [Leptolyngbyaceae cyanobacterium bins.302]
MTEPFFNTIKQEYHQDSNPFSSSAPTIGWGIALLLLGILIGKQLTRQQPPTTASDADSTDIDHIDQLAFTQALQWVSYGKNLERKEQYEAAIAVYDRGLSQHPNNFRLWHERGLALAKLQQFESALESFDHAYRLRPNDGDLAHERGDTLLQLEQFEAAIASFDICLRYHPDNTHILADKGYALCQLGQFAEALQCLNQVLKLERENRSILSYAHYYQIEALRHLEEFDAAIHSSHLAIEQYGDQNFTAQHQVIQQQITEAALGSGIAANNQEANHPAT